MWAARFACMNVYELVYYAAIANCSVYFLCRLGYMFWTDVYHHEILAARLNGSQLVKLVTSGITTPGTQLALPLAQLLNHCMCIP